MQNFLIIPSTYIPHTKSENIFLNIGDFKTNFAGSWGTKLFSPLSWSVLVHTYTYIHKYTHTYTHTEMHLENEAWVVASYNGEAENTQTVAFPLTITMAHLVTL